METSNLLTFLFIISWTLNKYIFSVFFITKSKWSSFFCTKKSLGRESQQQKITSVHSQWLFHAQGIITKLDISNIFNLISISNHLSIGDHSLPSEVLSTQACWCTQQMYDKNRKSEEVSDDPDICKIQSCLKEKQK